VITGSVVGIILKMTAVRKQELTSILSVALSNHLQTCMKCKLWRVTSWNGWYLAEIC